jgi:hypothetical protein
MRVIGNATALLVAVSIMIGLLFVQKNYQNSWHQPTAANRGLEAATGYRVVIK